MSQTTIATTDSPETGRVAINANFTEIYAANNPAIKRYVALLTQTSTNNPVPTVLENTLGGTVAWTRDSTGLYLGTLASTFTANKTVINETSGGTSVEKVLTGDIEGAIAGYFICGISSVNAVQITTVNSSRTLTDGLLTQFVVSVTVYP